jgi:hypothetical protein
VLQVGREAVNLRAHLHAAKVGINRRQGRLMTLLVTNPIVLEYIRRFVEYVYKFDHCRSAQQRSTSAHTRQESG